MKNVLGGKVAPGGGGGCPAACVKAGSDGSVSSGSCSATSVTIGGVTFAGCECSVTGGSGCSS